MMGRVKTRIHRQGLPPVKKSGPALRLGLEEIPFFIQFERCLTLFSGV
jgi:hypothetical protein